MALKVTCSISSFFDGCSSRRSSFTTYGERGVDCFGLRVLLCVRDVRVCCLAGQYELTTRWTMGMKLGVLVRTQVLRRYLRTEGGATGDQRPEASDH
eukprot:1190937-Prorocentrum_minimum.AAC.1